MPVTDFDSLTYDRADPDPWLALYLDSSIPIADSVKRALLISQQSRSRQLLLPIVRPFARLAIVLIQLFRVFVPNRLTSSRMLHRLLAWSMKTWVTPEANYLILRHFHIGSQVLAFIARNVPGVDIPLRPLEPGRVDDIRDHLFLQHDLNLYNFVIELNRQLRANNAKIETPATLDFSAIHEPVAFEEFPRRWHNAIDLQTALEVFTPLYQLFLKDAEFWRASTSLQLDESVAIYVSTILGDRSWLGLVNNRHPLVPLTTLRAGYRLMLHGLATETLHALLLEAKQRAAATVAFVNAPQRLAADPSWSARR